MGWQDGAAVVSDVPAWQAAPAVDPDTSAIRRHFESVRGAKSFTDYLEAGWQQSVTGLATRGKVPDVALTEDSPWYGRLATSLSTMAGDSPAMLVGFGGGALAGGAAGTAVPVVGNAVGATVGGFAGAGALPAGLRAAMMEAYTKGEITSASDFIDRALTVSLETAKGGVTGAAMGGAGVLAKAALPVALPAVARGVATTAAEVTALTTVGKGLEGKLPEPQDFLDAGVLLFGAKGAALGAGKLRAIYTATGKTPIEVLADAKANPKLLEQLVAEPAARVAGEPPMIDIPAEYQPLALRETARAAVPDISAQTHDVAASPFAEIPQAKGEPARPTHVNYDYLNTTDDAAAALSRLSQVYEQRITEQRRGTVSWDETSAEAGRMLSDVLGGADMKLVAPREPGTAAGAAEILARKQLVIGAAEDMSVRAKAYLEKGADASPEDTAAFLGSIERTAMIQAQFLGARAEAGRALNILKSTARDAERVKLVKQVVDMYGKDPAKLAAMIGEIDNPAGALKFAKEAVKATTWEKLVEGWKAGLLSGPVTHVANVLGNTAFMALRAPIDSVASGIGALRFAPKGERVAAAEPLARVAGAIMGSMDALRVAGGVLRTGEAMGKAEGTRPQGAIEGLKGEVIRLPFRFLSAEDAIFKTLNERGELATLAVRQAGEEGFNPLTAEYRQRVAQLMQEPTVEMADAAKDAAERFTFNKELGEKGQAVQKFVKAWHLEWLLPFIRTPANIVKEMTRLTPLAPLVKEWRDAFAKGGIERDKAVAEMAVGTSIMTTVFVHALNGKISGAGEPDQGKKRVQSASGWQPYSIKVGDTWYSYERLQPIGTLIGMAADLAEVWDHLTDEESDKVPKMLAVAFANAVTNQTFLQGITKLVNAVSDPKRFGPKFLEGLAGSMVPAAVAQVANFRDPLARETNGMIDAIKSRIPGLRETLLPKRDVYGEPEANKDRLLGVMPITKKTESDDKVRSEAARLNISAGDAPKQIHVGRGTGKPGDVKLEPEQRDIFTDVGGHLAMEILAPIVNSPAWDALPPLVQKRAYAKAFMAGHKQGALAAVPPELRATLLPEITQKIAAELVPGNE